MKKALAILLTLTIVCTLFLGLGTMSVNAVSAWAPNTAYAVNDLVTYGGSTYKCLQAHTSLVGWEPPNVPALWQLQSGPTATPTPTPNGTATPTPNGTATPTPATTPTPTPAGGGTWGSKVFAPYVDVLLWPTFSINTCYTKTTQKYYTLAFITSDGSSNPAWGGIVPLSDNFYLTEVNDIRSKGGDVIISFGGANGTELATSNTNVATLQSKYQSVIDKYKVTWIDFDIEGAAVADTAAADRRAKAIKGLQTANPNLKVAFCLPVLPSGLTQDGLNILSNAKANGVRIDVVNVMAMDYGDYAAPNPEGKMGDYATQAATSTHNQCTSLGITTKIGITPMIGQNDCSTERFYQADATKVLNFANSNSWVGLIAMWSACRDNNNGGDLSHSSQISQAEFDFTNIWKAYK